jgi:hypothetical protein
MFAVATSAQTHPHIGVSGRRYYSPKQGRFWGRDAISETGGRNLYGFVINSPVNLWDYLGYFPGEIPSHCMWDPVMGFVCNPVVMDPYEVRESRFKPLPINVSYSPPPPPKIPALVAVGSGTPSFTWTVPCADAGISLAGRRQQWERANAEANAGANGLRRELIYGDLSDSIHSALVKTFSEQGVIENATEFSNLQLAMDLFSTLFPQQKGFPKGSML